MNTKKSFENRKTNALRRSLYFLSVMSLMSGCSLEDPAFTDYVDSNNQFITCENVKAIYFTDATLTLSNHTYNGKDYSAAFKYNMCPAAAPNCIPDTENSHVCTSSCSNVCYGECVSDYIDINIVSCNHPDGKTITCVEGFADCDGNINNGCEFNLEAGNATDCHYDSNTETVELDCEAGLANCDNNYLNGCEYDLVTNKALSCVNHVVTCLNDAEFSDCDDNYKNGCEFDIVSHNAIACANKNITCRTGYGDCNNYYLDGCEIDLNSNLANCGACTKYTMDAEGNKTVTEDHACPSGEVCNGFGVCAASCIDGSISCGGSCINTATNHIDVPAGGCEAFIAENEEIVTLVHCVSNYANCDDIPSNGCEFSLSSNNAIACEHQAVLCQDSFADCDGDYKNGCEFSLVPNHATACTRTVHEGDSVTVTLDCANDYANCNGDYKDGCEFQLSTHYASECQRTFDEATENETVTLTCIGNKADCDGNYENGCEYDLSISHTESCIYNLEYCTQDNINCDSEEHITKRGLITCSLPYADIDKDYQNGCEIDGSWSLQYCGAKGSADDEDPESDNFKGEACSGGQVCYSGTCGFTCDTEHGYNLCTDKCLNFETLHLSDCNACATGYCDIDGNLENGCEVNFEFLDSYSVKLIRILPEYIPVIQALLKMYNIEFDIPEGKDTCSPCPPGFIPNEDHTNCVQCGAGQYTAFVGGPCERCPAGTYIAKTMFAFSNDCLSCPVGTYADSLGSTKCTPCAGGTFAPSEGSVVCPVCPANTYSEPGASECIPCEAGTGSEPGSTACTPCPEDAISTRGGECVPCAEGTTPSSDHTQCVRIDAT